MMEEVLPETPGCTQQVSRAISVITQLKPKEFDAIIGAMEKIMRERSQWQRAPTAVVANRPKWPQVWKAGVSLP